MMNMVMDDEFPLIKIVYLFLLKIIYLFLIKKIAQQASDFLE